MNECCNIEEVVQQTYSRLLNYLRKQSCDNALADDITQVVMEKLVKAHNENKELADPGAWLFRVAKNQLSDHFRRKKPVLSMNEDMGSIEAGSADNSPEAMAEDFIPLMLDLLPPMYGQPLAMSYLNGYTAKEIADRTEISESAAKMRIRRARKMLLELFEDCCEIVYSKSGGFASCTVKDSCLSLSQV